VGERAASDGTVTGFACLPVLFGPSPSDEMKQGGAILPATPASSPRWVATATGRQQMLSAWPLDESSAAFACGHGDRASCRLRWAHATGAVEPEGRGGEVEGHRSFHRRAHWCMHVHRSSTAKRSVQSWPSSSICFMRSVVPKVYLLAEVITRAVTARRIPRLDHLIVLLQPQRHIASDSHS
jgi:hypothetical protein